MSGEEATTAFYKVSASANNDSYGYVIGGGIYQYGNFAQFEAFPEDGYVFIGWFDGNQIVSTDSLYRFAVTSDKTLTAVFGKEQKPVKPAKPKDDKTPSSRVIEIGRKAEELKETNPETGAPTIDFCSVVVVLGVVCVYLKKH